MMTMMVMLEKFVALKTKGHEYGKNKVKVKSIKTQKG